MQRSSELNASFLFRSIPDSSNRRHGVNRICHLSRGLFHPSMVETLELVLAEVQLLLDALKSMMMLLRLQHRSALALSLICLLQLCWVHVEHLEALAYRQWQLNGLLTCGFPILAVDHHVASVCCSLRSHRAVEKVKVEGVVGRFEESNVRQKSVLEVAGRRTRYQLG